MIKSYLSAKRSIAWLVIACIFAAVVPVYAAEDTASTMRIDKTSGTVSMVNQNGTDVTISDGKRIYDGYNISTKAKSYAYFSLDKSKAAKLGASSSAEVRKSGKKLQLLVNSGELLFNISEKLDADEVLEVRTASMVTGVRGTIGSVSDAGDSSTLVMLEGEVSVVVENEAAGTATDIIVPAGQVLITSSIDGNPDNATAEVRALTVADISPMVAAEIKANPALASRIALALNIDMDSVISNADARLAAQEVQQQAEQTRAEAQQKLQNAEMDDMFNGNGDQGGNGDTSTNPSSSSPSSSSQPSSSPSSSSSSSSSTTSSSSSTTSSDDTVSSEPDDEPDGDFVLDGTGSLKDALASNNVIYIRSKVTNSDAVEVEANKKIYIEDGAKFTNEGSLTLKTGSVMTVADGCTLANEGSLDLRNGTFTNNGCLDMYGDGSATNIPNKAGDGLFVKRDGAYFDAPDGFINFSATLDGATVNFYGNDLKRLIYNIKESFSGATDLKLNTQVVFTSDYDIDFDGAEINCATASPSMTIDSGKNVTMSNVLLTRSEYSGTIIESHGNLTLENMTIESTYISASSDDSVVNANGGKLSLKSSIIKSALNPAVYAENTTLNVDNLSSIVNTGSDTTHSYALLTGSGFTLELENGGTVCAEGQDLVCNPMADSYKAVEGRGSTFELQKIA